MKRILYEGIRLNFLIIILSLFFHTPVKAQFEQKFSLDLGFGTILPIGAEDFTYIDGGMELIDPYFMSNFGIGFSFVGGVRYNFSRKFSLGASIRILDCWNWYYEYYDPFDDEYYSFLSFEEEDELGNIVEWENYLGVWNISIGISPKFNFLPGSKINPYIYLDLNLNYTDLNYEDMSPEAVSSPEGGFSTWIESSVGVGFYPALGIDYSINENFGMFLRGGYSFVGMNEEDWWDADLEAENFKMIKVELGVQFSFLKSKDF